MEDDLSLALRLADLADRISLRHFRTSGLGVDTKPDRSPVSVADREVEAALRRELGAARPRDAIVGEEEGGDDRPGTARRWILDPIDGTRAYIRGLPVFASLIALEVDGGVELGVASAPALRRRWWAVRGQGAFADSAPIHVSAVSRIEDAFISTTDSHELRDRGRRHAYGTLAGRAATSRALGDFWSHVLVAEGGVDIAVEPVASVWDLAALQVIVEEAGGRFTDLEGGRRIDGGSGLSTNGRLHDAVLEALRV